MRRFKTARLTIEKYPPMYGPPPLPYALRYAPFSKKATTSYIGIFLRFLESSRLSFETEKLVNGSSRQLHLCRGTVLLTVPCVLCATSNPHDNYRFCCCYENFLFSYILMFEHDFL